MNQFLNTQYESLPNKDEEFVLQRQFQDTEEHPINYRRTYQSREEVPYHPRANFQNSPLREIAEFPDSIATNQIKQYQFFVSYPGRVEKMQVENQKAMKGIIASVNQQKPQAMTTDAPSSFCSPLPSRNHSTANNSPSRELNKTSISSKKKIVKNLKAK